MAKSIISYDSSVFKRKNQSRNITSSDIDDMTNIGIYHGFFDSGTPFTANWGILIVVPRADTGNPCEQIQIAHTGIAVRHKENGTWSSWRIVGLTQSS